MKYISTRGNYGRVDSAEAIRLGMVPKGGLFVPEIVPELSLKEILSFKDFDYRQLAARILQEFLTDFTEEEIWQCVEAAYNAENFAAPDIAPLKKLDENTYILELWHGPTAAFKDMALQLMPHLLTRAIEKGDIDKEVVILVATSGDTGKAALEGFKDVDGVRIIVFYPEEGVSKIQEAQMVTTGGYNTEVVAVKGNFDDCQNSVKSVFGDRKFNQKINNNGFRFSSANSINWGRLVPQIIYYFKAYLDLVNRGEIEGGEEINVTVPTGNFGNILAGYYASRMGLPVKKFICASNENKILTDFINTGKYDLEREFRRTISPSMDILISSNLERFLFSVTGQDHKKINKWYAELRNNGKFVVDKTTAGEIAEIFSGRFATEGDTKETIKDIYEEYAYTIDPHTAVGVSAYRKYCKETKDLTKTVIDSTASPFKFGRAVLSALKGKKIGGDDFEVLRQLEAETGENAHRALSDLEERPVRHERACSSRDIRDEIRDILEIN
ncbi:MAG: threonine synthase [Halanaerobiaceae bacterium]